MAKKLILSGNVQGVRCRGFCQDIAVIMGIHGSASNLNSGDVQVILDTDNDFFLQEYIKQLHTNSLNIRYWGKISKVKTDDYNGSIRGDYNF